MVHVMHTPRRRLLPTTQAFANGMGPAAIVLQTPRHAQPPQPAQPKDHQLQKHAQS